MADSPHSLWLHRFAVLTAGATLMLIGIGGMVTSRGVGMAVPDWPTTYGHNMFLFPVSQMVGGIFFEHTHRLVASIVGLLSLILAAWMWGRETAGTIRWLGIGMMALTTGMLGIRESSVFIGLALLAAGLIGYCGFRVSHSPGERRWWGVMALALVMIQGILGGLRVTLYQDELGIVHAAVAQLFLVLICGIALFTSRWWKAVIRPNIRIVRLPVFFLVATGLIFVQLILGATMRHQQAGLAVPDFPLAYGKVWPPLDEAFIERVNQQRMDVRDFKAITPFHVLLHMAHRIGAVVVLVAVGFGAARTGRQLGRQHPLSRMSAVWFGVVLLQAVLGAATVWSDKSADIATAHVVLGAICLVFASTLSLMAFRYQYVATGQTDRAGATGIRDLTAALREPARWASVR